MRIGTASTGYPLMIAVGNDAAGWPSRKDALAGLQGLRERGFNCEQDIEVNRAHTRLFRFWVISRPDHYQVTTSLMTRTGSRLLGRLTGESPCFHEPRCREQHPVWWTPLSTDPCPATFTHLTRTVRHHQPGRHERFRTKSNGSCGRWVLLDDAVALCTCGWKSYASTRPEAQAAARYHRDTAPPP